jgi:uncharacterized protein YPO0396
MNPRTYEIPYIGLKATEMQIKYEELEFSRIQNELDNLHKSVNNSSNLLSIVGQSRLNVISSQNQVRYFELVKQTKAQILNLEDRISELSTDKAVNQLETKLDHHKEIRRDLRTQSDDLVGKMAECRKERQDLITLVDETKEVLKALIDEQREYANTYATKLNTAFVQFNALKQRFKNDYHRISKELVDSSNSIKNQSLKAENDVLNLMRNYIGTYHFGANADLKELIEFEREANLIRNNNLVQYEQEAIELRRNAETSFKEEFIFKLRASIEAAQQQIDELNTALYGKKFGKDSYQLTYGPADDPNFKQYYNMIMSNRIIDSSDLFTHNLSKTQEQILAELFLKISSNDPQFEKFSYQYLDYRYYMQYDIEISNENGNRSFFSKVSRQKSGGETQSPFYIVIAASFQQLLSKNKRSDSGCIVLFDEAFNNMDEARIDALMRFYNSLSIQVCIAVPPGRVPVIINYVNTAVMAIKQDDLSVAHVFKKEGEIGENV